MLKYIPEEDTFAEICCKESTNLFLVQEDTNANKESYCFTEPQRSLTKFITQKKEIKTEIQSCDSNSCNHKLYQVLYFPSFALNTNHRTDKRVKKVLYCGCGHTASFYCMEHFPCSWLSKFLVCFIWRSGTAKVFRNDRNLSPAISHLFRWVFICTCHLRINL